MRILTLLFATLPLVAQSAISADRLLQHIKVLASDAYEGRGVATPGEEKTVAYLRDEMQKAGLRPGNPDGTWVQNVALMGIRTAAKTSVSVGGKAVTLEEKKDIVTVSRRFAKSVAVNKSDIVFVGYGAVAPEYGWDDYKDVDVRGKTILMLINDPQVTTADGKLDDRMFKGRAMTYYGRWTYKYEIASKKGAAAAIIIHETDMAAYPFDVVVGSWGQENFDLARKDGNRGRVAAESWITREKAGELVSAAGLSLEELKRQALRKDFRPVTLKGAQASFAIQNTLREVRSKNVLGKIEGTDPQLRNELILYSAHWDHLGKDPQLAADQIYNGAVDNAAGCSALLEVARVMASAPPKRSVVFLFPTAEEKGLLGALHYAENPLYPAARTVANINVDGFNVWGKTSDVVLIGAGSSTLDELAAQLASKQGRTTQPDPEPERGYFYRSDHVEFMKKGIPALYLKAGEQYRGKPQDFAVSKRTQYVGSRYHKPADEVDPAWDLSGAAEDVTILLEAGRALGNGTAKAEWKAGSEFRRQ